MASNLPCRTCGHEMNEHYIGHGCNVKGCGCDDHARAAGADMDCGFCYMAMHLKLESDRNEKMLIGVTAARVANEKALVLLTQMRATTVETLAAIRAVESEGF